MSDQPQTESGRALLRDYLSPGGTTMFLSDILAIEQEAASKAVAGLERLALEAADAAVAEVLERLETTARGWWGDGMTMDYVRALIASERER